MELKHNFSSEPNYLPFLESLKKQNLDEEPNWRTIFDLFGLNEEDIEEQEPGVLLNRINKQYRYISKAINTMANQEEKNLYIKILNINRDILLDYIKNKYGLS